MHRKINAKLGIFVILQKGLLFLDEAPVLALLEDSGRTERPHALLGACVKPCGGIEKKGGA